MQLWALHDLALVVANVRAVPGVERTAGRTSNLDAVLRTRRRRTALGSLDPRGSAHRRLATAGSRDGGIRLQTVARLLTPLHARAGSCRRVRVTTGADLDDGLPTRVRRGEPARRARTVSPVARGARWPSTKTTSGAGLGLCRSRQHGGTPVGVRAS
jgi:hypothetical protein